MRLLLDTHTFLWFVDGSPQLSADAKRQIEDPGNEILLSVGSLWEMAIKMSLGKLTLTQPFEVFVPQQIQLNGFGLLGITVSHLAKVTELPFHHRDPFDRLLIAQALVESLPIVGVDTAFDPYGITRIW